jgi:catechol 2,3-dioxygenase-like lactoylglutathione lyase family enzyme
MYKSSNVTVLVTDMSRAVSFYTGTLGLRLIHSFGDYWAEVEAPGVRIGLHPGRKGAPSESGSANLSIGFQVDDLDAATQRLQEKGVTFKKSNADKGSRQAFFTDPDGTPLYLIEIKFG